MYSYEDKKGIIKIIDSLLNDLQEAICITDKDCIVMYWNKYAEELYNIDRTEIVGERIDSYFSNAIAIKVAKDKRIYRDVYHSPREGSHIIINAAPIIVDGEFKGVISTEKDISAIKSINHELEKIRERAEFLEEEIMRLTGSWNSIQSKNKKMQTMIEIAKRAAPTTASILITGESGTGKEVFARAIHEQSKVKGSFIPVNCSAIPNDLFESEFFGYDKGAFTGANTSGKKGFFEMAKDGTLFLDEIADLPLFMQSKLLRALEDKQIKRVGAEKYIEINTRIIAATNKCLEKQVEEGKFREDLYYRLNVIRINLPPLRERKEDIIPLLEHFLKEVNKDKKDKKGVKFRLDKDSVKILTKYSWKGNIRELKNAAEQIVILSSSDLIKKDDLPEYILKSTKIEYDNDKKTLREAISEYEKMMILNTLKSTDGNVAKASKILGIPRSTLHYKMNTYNIDVSNI